MEEAIDVPAYMAILAGDGGTRTRGERTDASKREEIGVVVDAELGIPIPRRRDDMGFAHALPPLEFRGQPFDAGVSFVLHVWQQERNIEPNFFGHIVSPFNGLTACGASLNAPTLGDRKSVVSAKSVSVRVDHGGRR